MQARQRCDPLGDPPGAPRAMPKTPTPTPTPAARRRLQMHSCDACRRRKVRCDSEDEAPCSACTKAGVVCRFTVGWRRRKHRRVPSAAATAATACRPPDADSPMAAGPVPAPSSTQSPDSPCRSSLSPTAPSRPSSAASAASAASPPCSCAWLSRHGSVASAASASAAAAAAAPESEVALSLNIAENGLHRFFQDGLSSASWTIFDRADHIRVTYAGTPTSNMAHLIQLGRPGSQYLIYPYPQIRPPVSALPAPHPPDALHDINAFPEKDIRDDLLDAYFARVNPYFPVIDEPAFRAAYRAGPTRQPPLLLLHAVLLVGAHVSAHARVRQARHVVKAVLFRRAKAVFDMRLEHDRLHLVQAALLFTWHLQNGDTASANSFFWLGTACRIAVGLGMHRSVLHDPPGPDRMPMADRRLWRRIWWTLFQAEVLSALEHGRPCAIRAEDFDHAPLCREDFADAAGRVDPRFDCAYCIANADLCRIALDVVTLSAPGVPTQDVEQRTGPLGAQLVAWMLALGGGSRGGGSHGQENSGLPPPDGSTSTFADINLRLHYNTVVIHLYRLLAATGRPLADAARDEARRVGSSASAAIVAGLETLHAQAMLAQCSFTAVTAVTAAAVQVARDTQHALGHGHAILAMNGLCLLDRACVVAEHLAVFWPNAEGVRKVFRTLFEQFTGALHGLRQGGGGDGDGDGDGAVGPGAAAPEDFGGLDWTEILGLTWDAGYAQDVQGLESFGEWIRE